MKNLEDNLAEVLSSCEYVDQAIENATPTQLLFFSQKTGEYSIIYDLVVNVVIIWRSVTV